LARNAGEYLPVAVESILQQSYPHFELIIVDDHSTDNAISNIQSGDTRLKIISASQRGVVNAMQQGVKQTSGDFIARMDGDDEALPNRLQVQLDYLHQYPTIGIVAAQVEIFSDEEVAEGFQLYQAWLNSICTTEDIKRELFIESPLPNPTIMFRRDIYQQLGGYHDSEWAEDYDCWLRAESLNIKMAKPDGILLRWRDHDNRLTRTDDRYSINNFMRAKAYYLAKSQLENKDVIIWGTGPTGIAFYELLQEHDIKVSGFIDVHPRRIGGVKRGLPVWSMDKVGVMDPLKDEIIIGAVGSRGAREKIRTYLKESGLEEGQDFIFVA